MNVLLCERINSANQYVEQLANAYQNAGHPTIVDVQNFLFSDFTPDILHIQWPEAIYRWRFNLPATTGTLALIKDRLNWYHSRGCCVVHTIHNLRPHTELGELFERDVYAAVLEYSDILVHHGEASIQLIEQAYGATATAARAVIVAPHGPYPVSPEDPGRARRRYDLPDDQTVFLSFGRQRDNKGPNFVQRCFEKSARTSPHLFVIGPRPITGSSTVARNLKRAARALQDRASPLTKRWNNSTVINREVTHQEIPLIMAAADALFLGHQSGLNSGIIALAASYAKPVVYPDIGNFSEQVAGWPWAFPYRANDLKSARSAIRAVLARLDTEARPALDNSEWLQQNSWERHVHAIINTVSDLAKQRRQANEPNRTRQEPDFAP
jgi:beta-1,4-mannosyltransferase